MYSQEEVVPQDPAGFMCFSCVSGGTLLICDEMIFETTSLSHKTDR